MKKASVLCVAVTLLVSAVAHGQSPAIERLPDGVVLVAEVGDITSFDQNLAGLIRQIDATAMVPPVGQMIPAMVLKTMDPFSVNLQEPFRVVILKPPLHTSPVLVFGVADPVRYLDSLMPHIQKERQEGNVHVFRESAPDQGLGGGDAGEGEPLIIGLVGDRAAMGQHIEAVTSVVALMEGGSLPPSRLFEDGDVGVAVRPKTLLDALDAAGQNPFDLLRTMLPMATMRAGPGMDPQQMMAMLNAELDAVEALVRQLDAMSLTIGLGQDDIVFTTRMRPVEGGGVSNYVASVPGGDLDLLQYMSADSMALIGGKLGDLGPFLEWYGGILETFMPGPAEPGSVEAWKAIMRESADVLGGEFAIAIGGGEQGALGITEAFMVKDPAQMDKLIDGFIALSQDLLAGYAQMGMKMEFQVHRDAVSHAGRDITIMEFDFQFAPVEGMPGAEGIAAMQQSMMDLMYGKERKAYSTYLDDAMIYTLGDGALDALKGIIDGLARPAADSDKLAEALTGMPPQPIAVGYLYLGEIADLIIRFARTAIAGTGQEVPSELESIRFESGPPIGFASWITDDNVVEKRLRIPVAAIRSIVVGIQRAQLAPPQAPPL